MSITLRAGGAALRVDPADGSRWTSWTVDGLELLTGVDEPGLAPRFRSGCFVMAPYAGRVDRGRMPLGGRVHQLPVVLGPHAIHGTVAAVPWEVVSASEDELFTATELEAPWPAAGRVEQRLRLRPDRLESRLELIAEAPQPVWIGWHPWFARRLARGGDAEWRLSGGLQHVRGEDGLPTGETVPRRPGPWDDAFEGFDTPPGLEWPGALSLTVASSADVFVLYDERPETVCLEPQTAPPDAVRLGRAQELATGERAVLECTWAWRAA